MLSMISLRLLFLFAFLACYAEGNRRRSFMQDREFEGNVGRARNSLPSLARIHERTASKSLNGLATVLFAKAPGRASGYPFFQPPGIRRLSTPLSRPSYWHSRPLMKLSNTDPEHIIDPTNGESHPSTPAVHPVKLDSHHDLKAKKNMPDDMLANAAAMVEEVNAARSAAEAQTMSNINATIANAAAIVEEVNAARSAAEAQTLSNINSTISNLSAAVESVKKQREVAEAEALEKIAEVASGLTKSAQAGSSFFSFLPSSLLVRRSIEIWTFVADMALKMASAKRSDSREARLKVGEELSDGLLRLGPTFIKLGQILSTRFDILPYDYVKGLEKLQDSCPPFDGKEAYEIVKKELGSTAFREFNQTPIAAASLGQVHLAVTADGRRVAVKVQRPGLKELFDADLANLKILADLLYRFDKSPDSMLRDWREIFESNSKLIYKEIDYGKELRNSKRFARNFQEYKWMKVPDAYEDLSSEHVLTMEYVPGVKISKVQELQRMGVDTNALATLSGECFMLQLLRHGYFHCDPHPGNIAVDVNGPGGSPRLIYYDFGMTEELSESFRKALVDGFFALYESKPKALVQSLIDGELLGGKVDRVAVESIARYFLSSFRQRLALDRAIPMDREERDQLRMATMQEVGNELAAVASDKPFRYPPALPYVLRAFNALEGVGKGLDVNYDISRIAKKYIKTLIDLRDGNALLTGWKKVTQRVGWRPKDFASIVQSPRRVTKVYETLAKLESGELQLRVRALELERAMVRNSVMQRASLNAIAACCALNIATILAVTPTMIVSVARKLLTRLAWASVWWFGFRTISLVRKFNLLQKGERDGQLNDYILESKNA